MRTQSAFYTLIAFAVMFMIYAITKVWWSLVILVILVIAAKKLYERFGGSK